MRDDLIPTIEIFGRGKTKERLTERETKREK